MARIVFTLEDGTEIETELGTDTITLGRHYDNHIVLPSASVSIHHAVIKRRGEDFYIQDLGTTNGIKVNGVEIEEARLSHGDRVTLGDVPSVVYLTNTLAVNPATSKVPTLPATIETTKQRSPILSAGAAPMQYKDSKESKTGSANMARIVFTLEDGTEIETKLDSDAITLGRHQDNRIVLPSASVSIHHAVIKRRGEDFYIQDLGTTNGIKVNGVEVEEARLSHGDRVTLGDVPSVVYLTNTLVANPYQSRTARLRMVDYLTNALAVKSAASKESILPSPIEARPIKASKQRSPIAGVGTAPVQYAEGTGCASFFLLLIFLTVTFVGGLCLRYYNETKNGPIDLLKTLLIRDMMEKEQKKPGNKPAAPKRSAQSLHTPSAHNCRVA